jgi:hypothetical protein
MIVKYPQLANEWDKEKNKGIDITKITCGNNTKYYWKCPEPDCGYERMTCPNERTKKNKYHGCIKCLRKKSPEVLAHLAAREKLKAEQNEINLNTSHMITGDNTENYIIKLLQSMGYEEIANLGRYRAQADISLVYNQVTYFLQVKNLFSKEKVPVTNVEESELTYEQASEPKKKPRKSKKAIVKSVEQPKLIQVEEQSEATKKPIKRKYIKNNKGVYSMHHTPGYPPNMLILMVNNDHTLFSVAPAGRFTSNPDFKYTVDSKSIYRDILFIDVELFKNRIKESLPLSCTELTFKEVNNNFKLKYESVQRFIAFCEQHGISYVRNLESKSFHDGTINNKKIKLRYKSLNEVDKNTYAISTSKGAGSVNGRSISIPLEIEDIDYIIAEIGSDDYNEDHMSPTKYHGQFCFISKELLMERQVFKTADTPGKTAISILPPDYMNKYLYKKDQNKREFPMEEDWSTQYWNKIPEEFLI